MLCWGTLPIDHVIRTKFREFDVQPTQNSECDLDYVAIDNTLYCGDQIPEFSRIKQNITVSFKTAWSPQEYTGFKLKIECYKKHCEWEEFSGTYLRNYPPGDREKNVFSTFDDAIAACFSFPIGDCGGVTQEDVGKYSARQGNVPFASDTSSNHTSFIRPQNTKCGKYVFTYLSGNILTKIHTMRPFLHVGIQKKHAKKTYGVYVWVVIGRLLQKRATWGKRQVLRQVGRF